MPGTVGAHHTSFTVANAGGHGVYLRDPNGILIDLFQPPRRLDTMK